MSRSPRALLSAAACTACAAVAAATAVAVPAVVAAPPAGAATFGAATSLGPGGTLTADGGRYHLTMQSDGNLVLYTDTGLPLWATGTSGQGPSSMVLQGDGNLVVYRASGGASWASGTRGSGATRLAVQGDGNVVLYAGSTPRWASWTNRPRVAPGATAMTGGTALVAGDRLTDSTGAYQLVQQFDGNLVLYGPGGALWSTGTWTQGPYTWTVLQGDGNLVTYSGTGNPLFWTMTNGRAAGALTVGTDGSLTLTGGAGQVTWQVSSTAVIEAQVLAQLNQERAANGVGPLATDTRLVRSALAHNQVMSATQTLSHQLPGEADLGTRVSATGYRWSVVAENIAWTSQRTLAGAQGVQDQMYTETAPNDGHRRNILDPRLTTVGVSVLLDGGRLWLTTDFGRPG